MAKGEGWLLNRNPTVAVTNTYHMISTVQEVGLRGEYGRILVLMEVPVSWEGT